jgi:hypothetical protein
MTVQEWRIESPIRRDLRLEHGWLSGRAKLFVDERLVFERPTTIIDKGFRHEIVVDDLQYFVSTRPSGFGFRYSFGRIEPGDVSAIPVKTKKPIRTWVLISFVSVFSVLFLAIGIGIQIPIGKLAAPQPIGFRLMNFIVGVVNVLAIIVVLSKRKLPKSNEDEDEIT